MKASCKTAGREGWFAGWTGYDILARGERWKGGVQAIL